MQQISIQYACEIQLKTTTKNVKVSIFEVGSFVGGNERPL